MVRPVTSPRHKSPPPASTYSYLSCNTPLFLACRSSSAAAAATARLLIAAGADVNSKNFGQGTEISHFESPLHAAAEVVMSARDVPLTAPSGNEAESRESLAHNEVNDNQYVAPLQFPTTAPGYRRAAGGRRSHKR